MKKNTNKQIIGITLTLIILTISIGNEILTPPQTVNASPNDIFASTRETVTKDWNSTTITKGATSTTEFHLKWTNYLSNTGWKDIDTTITPTTNGFEMTNAPFKLYLPTNSTGVVTFLNDNKYDVFNKEEINEEPLSMTIQAMKVNQVQGQIEVGDLIIPTGPQKNVNYVIYRNAYKDADLIYYVSFGTAPRLEKLIRFHSKPDELVYSFIVSYDNKIEMKREVDGEPQQWTEQTVTAVRQGPVQVSRDNLDTRSIGFKKFEIWDSNLDYTDDYITKRNKQPIQVDI